jgi:hypothetical protein
VTHDDAIAFPDLQPAHAVVAQNVQQPAGLGDQGRQPVGHHPSAGQPGLPGPPGGPAQQRGPPPHPLAGQIQGPPPAGQSVNSAPMGPVGPLPVNLQPDDFQALSDNDDPTGGSAQ